MSRLARPPVPPSCCACWGGSPDTAHKTTPPGHSRQGAAFRHDFAAALLTYDDATKAITSLSNLHWDPITSNFNISGSITSPTYSFNNDATTSISSQASNTIAFNIHDQEVARFDSNGNFGIGDSNPAYKLYVDGDIQASGNIGVLSDARVKKDIQPITNALDKILSLTGYTYKRTDLPDTAPRHTGLLAQDVLKVLPEAVTTDPNTGRLGVLYGNMIGLLVEAIKDLTCALQSRETL